MHRRFNNFISLPFYSPDDVSGSDGEQTFELLNEAEEPEEVLDLPKVGKTDTGDQDEQETDDEEEGEEDGEKSKEDDELKEIEEELDGPKEEDLELMTPVRRREILAKYPKLFKDFPYLEKAYYREQQFTEVYPTIQDARAAHEKSQILDRVEYEVLNGDITTVLEAAKSENSDAFYKIADNYLPTLKKVDSQAYYHVLGNVVKDTIITMVQEGRKLGDQGAPLTAAANILNQFVFGSQQFTPPTPLSKNSRPEDIQREQQQQQYEQQRVYQVFDGVREDLQTKADNVLTSTIVQHIDPRGTMTEYMKNHATAEALETLDDLIQRDTRFRGLLDRLWEKAFHQGFDKTSTDRIKSAYLSKAKTLLPSVIKKARNDALRGMGRRVREDSEGTDEKETTSKKGPITPGRSTAPSSGKYKNGKEIPKGMSTLDVLMQD